MARGHASSGVAFGCQVSLASFHLFFVSSKFSFVFMTFTSWKRTGPSGCGTKGPPAVPGTQLGPNTCYHGLSAYCVPDSSCTFSHSSLQQLSEGHVVGLPPLCTRGDRLGRVRACLRSCSQWEVGRDVHPRAVLRTTGPMCPGESSWCSICRCCFFDLRNSEVRRWLSRSWPLSTQNCPQKPMEIRLLTFALSPDLQAARWQLSFRALERFRANGGRG